MTISTGSVLTLFTSLLLQTLLTFSLAGQTAQLPDAPQKQTSAKPAPLPNPNAAGIYHVADGVTAPKLVYSVEPEFSEKARKRKVSGNVKVHFIIETDGLVRDATVVGSAADEFKNQKDRDAARELDQQAVKAASQYRFEPGQFQGKPVPVEMTIEINFQIF